MEEHTMHTAAQQMPSCCTPAADGAMGTHLMAGIPEWLYYASIVIVMLLSVLLFEAIRRKPGGTARAPKLDLTRFRLVAGLVHSRGVQLFIQMTMVSLFLMVLYSGFYGNQQPGRNIAPTLTWNVWWVGLIFLILFLGKIWCYACPWDAVTTWFRKLPLFGVNKAEAFNLGLPWPRSLRNIYPAVLFFVLLTWLELGFHVTLSPEKTAVLGLLMFGLVFLPGLVFEKKSFCRYGCLVGRISGLYAMFAPVEIRRRDAAVCGACKTADCYRGNERGNACPTGMNLKTMTANTYCLMCAECFRTCPNDNVALNLRPFSRDLVAGARPRKDEAYLALTLFALTAFHGLTMTPTWKIWVQGLQRTLHIGEGIAFTAGMALSLAIPILVYAGFVFLSRWLSRTTDVSYRSLFIKYAYGIIPIALFYHIAHNLEHFFMESQKLAVLVSDPFGYGWDLFRTASLQLSPLFSLQSIWYLQVLMIMLGHVFGLYISHRHSYEIFPDRGAAIRSQLPMICLMIALSVTSLWLVAQPMEMRTAM